MMRALLGTDGTPSSRAALARAVRLLHPEVSLTIASVAPIPSIGAGAWAPVGLAIAPLWSEVVEDRRRRAAEDAATAAQELAVPAEEVTALGPPGPTLCRLAKDGGHDLLVVSSRRVGLLERLFLGSLPQYVLKHAPCPVLVVAEVVPD